MSDPVIIDYPPDRESLTARLKRIVDEPEFMATVESTIAFLANHGISTIDAEEAPPLNVDRQAEADAAE